MRKIFIITAFVLLLASCSPKESGKKTTQPDYEPAYEYSDLDTGIRLSYVRLGEPEGSPVVLVHGATDSYISFSQVGAALASEGYCVYIPELRGHGNSDKPEDEVYSIELLAGDIDAWMKDIDLKNAHITGHSLGSFVAQELAISYPERVSSLTLIGSAANVAGNETLNWMLEGDEEFPGLKGMGGEIPDDFVEGWTYTTNYDERFAELSYRHARSLPYSSWISTFSFGSVAEDNTLRLSAVKVPVQIIWGSEDDFFPREDQLELIGALGSDTVLFITKRGAGHNTHWDGRLGEEIAGDINTFITDYAAI